MKTIYIVLASINIAVCLLQILVDYKLDRKYNVDKKNESIAWLCSILWCLN